MKSILVIGATSLIAHETAKLFAAQGARLGLAGRDVDKLNAVAADLKVRGAVEALVLPIQVEHTDTHTAFWERAVRALGDIDGVLIAHGSLPDQRACELSVEMTLREFGVNGLSVISLATVAGDYFERRQRGCLAVIGSVAGDRGRQSNYVYGAAKGAVAIFLAGLRNRLYKSSVSVITVKPGFVDTPMTAHLPKNALFAQPARVAADIHRAMERGLEIVYTPWFWRWIMLVIRHIPESVFKRLKL